MRLNGTFRTIVLLPASRTSFLASVSGMKKRRGWWTKRSRCLAGFFFLKLAEASHFDPFPRRCFWASSWLSAHISQTCVRVRVCVCVVVFPLSALRCDIGEEKNGRREAGMGASCSLLPSRGWAAKHDAIGSRLEEMYSPKYLGHTALKW